MNALQFVRLIFPDFWIQFGIPLTSAQRIPGAPFSRGGAAGGPGLGGGGAATAGWAVPALPAGRWAHPFPECAHHEARFFWKSWFGNIYGFVFTYVSSSLHPF